MSKTSKARRDSKKKNKRGRQILRAPQEPKIFAELVLDGHPFAGIAHDGQEWVLATHDGVAAGADDPGTIWGLVQAIASKAEANGNVVQLNYGQQFRSSIDEAELESMADELSEMADKVLTIYPLPAPALEQDPVQVTE